MFLSRRSFVNRRLGLAAAVVIQRTWRYTQALAVKKHEAAILLQRSLRMVQAQRFLMWARVCRAAAVVIQRNWRLTHGRLMARHSAAVQIQRLWRAFWAQLSFQIDLLDIVTVQCCARRLLASLKARKRASAIRVLQCVARVMLRRSRLNEKQKLRTAQLRTLQVGNELPLGVPRSSTRLSPLVHSRQGSSRCDESLVPL